MYVRRGPNLRPAIYGTLRWQRARRIFLRSNPHCRFCAAAGKTTPATVVDHIEAVRGDARRFWDQRNWQPLCRSCHSSGKRRIERIRQRCDERMAARYVTDADGWVTGLRT